MGGPAAKRKESPISLAKQGNDKPNRYREPKGEEIIGITWESVVFPTRIHQWTIQHKCDTNRMKRPLELKEAANESAAIIELHQAGSAPLEFCQ